MPGLTAACGFSLAASLIGTKRGGLRSLLSRCGLARVPHKVPRPRWGERVARQCYAVCAAWCASTFTRAKSACDALQKGGPEVQKRFEEACLASFRACWMRLAIRMPSCLAAFRACWMRLAIRMHSCLAGYEAMPRRGARACLVHWSVLQCNPRATYLHCICSPACMRTIPPVCSCLRTEPVLFASLRCPCHSVRLLLACANRIACGRAQAHKEMSSQLASAPHASAKPAEVSMSGTKAELESALAQLAEQQRQLQEEQVRGTGWLSALPTRIAISAADSPDRASGGKLCRSPLSAQSPFVRDTAPCGIPRRVGYRAVRDTAPCGIDVADVQAQYR